MKMRGRILASSLGLFVLTAGILLPVRGFARDDKGALPDEVQKIADALGKGDTETAKKQAADVAKTVDDIEGAMNLMGLRRPTGKNKAFGFGPPGGGAFKKDGIEAVLPSLQKQTLSPDQLGTEADAIVEMANRVAAIAEIAKAKPPAMDQGAKTKKAWGENADAMGEAAADLQKAAKAKDPAAIKSAAKKLGNTCTNCHSVFRE